MRFKTSSTGLPLGFLLLAGLAQALDPKSPTNQYSHTLWQTVEGLPDNSIRTTLQTRDGYLWIGTLEGLVRFDGMQFTTFDTQNTPALKRNHVTALCEDRRGSLWIGTSGGGITIYESGAFKTTYTTTNGLPNDCCWAISFRQRSCWRASVTIRRRGR